MKAQRLSGAYWGATVAAFCATGIWNQYLVLSIAVDHLDGGQRVPVPVAVVAAVASYGFHVMVWLVVSAAILGLLRILSPECGLRYSGVLGITGLAHVPLVLWSLSALLVLLGVRRELAGSGVLPPEAVQAAMSRGLEAVIVAKPYAYVGAAALATLVLRRVESVSWRQAVVACLVPTGLLAALAGGVMWQ